jgi:hypothetical protein
MGISGRDRVGMFAHHIQGAHRQGGDVRPRLAPARGRERQADLLEGGHDAVPRVGMLDADTDPAQADQGLEGAADPVGRVGLLLPPGLTPGRRGSALAPAATIVALAVPMVIATLALAPALVSCPFLSAAHRRFVTGLLASLRQWTLALATACTGVSAPDSGPRGPTC